MSKETDEKRKGMVSERQLDVDKINKGEKPPAAELTLVFVAEYLNQINDKMARLLKYFEGAEKTITPTPTPTVAPTTTPAPAEDTSGRPEKPAGRRPMTRTDEIVQAFEPFAELVTVDVDSSAQFVIVKPRKYLGDKWNELKDIATRLSGSWISQGKEGHFKIPKIVAVPEQIPSSSAPRPKPSTDGPWTVENVKLLFTQDLEDMLLFDEKNEYITIRPRQFLGSDNFAKIASVIRDNGGEYVSAGKDSHFRLLKKRA